MLTDYETLKLSQIKLSSKQLCFFIVAYTFFENMQKDCKKVEKLLTLITLNVENFKQKP